MWMYLLKSVLCLLVFFIFYKLLLERTSLHLFKRFYLLGVLLLAFAIPGVSFTYEVVMPTLDYTEAPMISEEVPVAPGAIYFSTVLWVLYGAGVLLFGIKFGRNLIRLFHKIRNNPKYYQDREIHVLLKDPTVPHTFFKYIFLNKFKFEAREIPKTVLLHEQTHAREKHSLDVIVIELLQIALWWNPIIHLFKKSIKLNHEFLADRAVLREGVATTDYQQTLLAFSSNAGYSPLASSINYSLIKKRLRIMKTRTSNKFRWIIGMLLVPLIGTLIYGFSNKVPVLAGTEPEKETAPMIVTMEETEPEIVDNLIPPAEPVIAAIQERATQKMVDEYNTLAKKYNASSRGPLRIHSKDVERMEYIYDLMSNEQRKNAEPFPDLPEPPPPPPVPDAPDPAATNAFRTPPPPPPPPPAGLSKEEEKRYFKALKNYEKALKAYEKSQGGKKASRRKSKEAMKERKKMLENRDEQMARRYEEARNRMEKLQEDRDRALVERKESQHVEKAERLQVRFKEMQERSQERSERLMERAEALKERQDEMRKRREANKEGENENGGTMMRIPSESLNNKLDDNLSLINKNSQTNLSVKNATFIENSQNNL